MKKAIVYGAGSIGRGLIGYLFSKSGYEVVFIDVNDEIINETNKLGRYPIKIVTNDDAWEVTVENVRGVSASNAELVAYEIANADIIATSVGIHILSLITKPIAMGLQKRWSAGNFTPLNIIVCENMIKANEYLSQLIRKELSEADAKIFDRTTGLIETCIGRNVPVMTQEMQEGNPLRIIAEEYCMLPVDRDSFKGEIPNIFNMVPFSNFGYYIHRKLFMHNMAHATSSYLGFIYGKEFLWQAFENPIIKLITLRSLIESSSALSFEHHVPLMSLVDYSQDLIYRFENRPLGVTIERIGMDPERKLSEGDRLIGSANLCMKHGIKPIYISMGIAAAFMFSYPNDPSAAKVLQIVSNEGIETAVFKLCNLNADNQITKYILIYYNMMKNGTMLEDLLYKAEKLKHEDVSSCEQI
jgi:mannitol-1-phosphate 5-dehydrogenase